MAVAQVALDWFYLGFFPLIYALPLSQSWALAIGVTSRCDGCIAYHARNSLRAGATRQEVAETLAVAVQMGGGPAMVHAADALKAYDEFVAAAAPPSASA